MSIFVSKSTGTTPTHPTCEYDGVGAGFAPQLQEVHHIAEPQWGVAGEHHTRGTQVLVKSLCNTDLLQVKSRQVNLIYYTDKWYSYYN